MDIGVVLAVLWPYLAALYLLDCFLVVRGGHMILSGTAFAGFTATGPGLRLAGLLPWDWSVLTSREPLLLSAEGIYVRPVPASSNTRPPGPDDLELVPYDDMGTVRCEGRKILSGQKVIHAAPTNLAAGFVHNRVKTVLNTEPGKRNDLLLRFILESADLEAIRTAVEGIKRSAAWLIYSSTVLFVLVFLALPVSLIVRVGPVWLWTELALMAIMCLLVAALWFRAHRKLLPVNSADRWEELLVFVFFPVSLPHAFGKLTRRLLVSFDQVALTAVLEPGMAAEILEKEYIWTRAAADTGAGEDLRAIWSARLKVLEELAGELGLDLVRLNEDLNVSENTKDPICPLCSATYRDGVTRCADCAVPLMQPKSLDDQAGMAEHI